MFGSKSAAAALRELDRATSSVGKALQRLSSGLRINSASDDAAGLSIASSLDAKSRIYTQAIRNANDGISALNIAEGTTSQLSNIVTRLKELATQSANGSFSTKQRLALDKENEQLTLEFNRLTASTSFNGLNLLDGALAVEPNDLGRQINAVGRSNEQQHRAARPVGVDLQLHLVAGDVFAFVGDQF